MEVIKIKVNKQIDGYTFSLAPSVRQLKKSLFPDSHPANYIFVGYDIDSGFEIYYHKLEAYIYPALLGVDKNDLNKKIEEITFIDTRTGVILHQYKIVAWKDAVKFLIV